jgi:hypothetical protein
MFLILATGVALWIGYHDAAIIPTELRPVRRLGKPILVQLLIEVLAEFI